MPKKALLLINRHARKGKQFFAQAIDTLDDLDFELITVPLKNSPDIAQLVRQYSKQVDLIIIGGGDGTLNAVVDTLVDVKLPLGILPLGTANDLARTLEIPQSIPDACRVIAEGHLKEIDLGCVNDKYFFNVASMGLSVNITEKLTKGAKRRWGILAYGFTTIQILAQNRPFRAEIHINEEITQVKTLQIAVGNGRYYGGGMAIAEDASIDDQRLDLYSLEIQHWWQIFPMIFTLRQGQHGAFSWVRTLQGKEITIHTRKPHSINTDGEITVSTPATFRVIPKALSVFVPKPQEIGEEGRRG